jgi:hypothetical protein
VDYSRVYCWSLSFAVLRSVMGSVTDFDYINRKFRVYKYTRKGKVGKPKAFINADD